MGEVRRLVDRHYQAMQDGDEDAALAVFAEDVVTDFPGAGHLHGREAFRGVVQPFLAAAPGAGMTIEHAVESGDTIYVEGRYIGTQSGPLRGPQGEMPASGRRFDLRFCDVMRAHDGKVIEHRLYFDQMEFLGQLGFAPQGAPAEAGAV